MSTMIRRRVAIAFGAGAVAVVLAGTAGTAQAETTPSPTAAASATGGPTATSTPAPPPSSTAATTARTSSTTASIPAYLRTSVTIDKKSTITVDVATGVVSVRFRSSIAKKRPVSLQRRVDGAWAQVSTKKMDAKGRVTFHAGTYQRDSIYRAVELGYKVKKKTAPLRATRSAGWDLGLSDSFSGDSLDTTYWSHRPSQAWGARLCSRTMPEMYSLSDGKFVAEVGYEPDLDLAKWYDQNAKRAQAASGVDVVGCVNGGWKSPTKLGVFRSAMVTTQGKYAVNTGTAGTVAARVKFPEEQGMHGAVWLQTADKGEVDMIEGFGYGRGISNYIHTASKKTLNAKGTASTKLGAYVEGSKTKKRGWWDDYHTYSVSWTSTGFTFRVDGKVTQKVKIKPGDVDYSLVVSLLVSDWEAYRVTSPVRTKGFKDVKAATLPVTMSVDWVRVWQKA